MDEGSLGDGKSWDAQLFFLFVSPMFGLRSSLRLDCSFSAANSLAKTFRHTQDGIMIASAAHNSSLGAPVMDKKLARSRRDGHAGGLNERSASQTTWLKGSFSKKNQSFSITRGRSDRMSIAMRQTTDTQDCRDYEEDRAENCGKTILQRCARYRRTTRLPFTCSNWQFISAPFLCALPSICSAHPGQLRSATPSAGEAGGW